MFYTISHSIESVNGMCHGFICNGEPILTGKTYEILWILFCFHWKGHFWKWLQSFFIRLKWLLIQKLLITFNIDQVSILRVYPTRSRLFVYLFSFRVTLQICQYDKYIKVMQLFYWRFDILGMPNARLFLLKTPCFSFVKDILESLPMSQTPWNANRLTDGVNEAKQRYKILFDDFQ